MKKRYLARKAYPDIFDAQVFGDESNAAHRRVVAALKNLQEGKLEEVFGTGTAAVISPVGELRYEDDVCKINDGKIGDVTQRLYDTLTGIQWGTKPDDMGWTVPVE